VEEEGILSMKRDEKETLSDLQRAEPGEREQQPEGSFSASDKRESERERERERARARWRE
jgi:hypothetical protein